MIDKNVIVRYTSDGEHELCRNCLNEKTCSDEPNYYEDDDGNGYECDMYEPKEGE